MPKITSRGVPSSESLYLPRYDSPEIRSFENSDGTPTRNLWNLEEVVNFVFSKKYQPTYYEVALKFLKALTDKVSMNGADISAFLKENNISKATFYNRVLLRLKRIGMVKVERDTLVNVAEKRKYRPMRVSLSKTFGNYFMKIADSWLAIVDDARTRK